MRHAKYARARRGAPSPEAQEKKWKQFRVGDVRRHVEFDCDKHVRLLVRRGFLQVVPGGEGGEGARLEQLAWPPPVEFTEGDGDVIGLAYYVQKWF